MIEDCAHERTELRWFTASNGARHLRPQCLACGLDPKGFGAVPKSCAKGGEAEWDYSIRDSLEWCDGCDDVYDDEGLPW